MEVYRVDPAGLQDIIVFARTYDHAAEIFVTHYMAVRDSAPGKFGISRWVPPSEEERRLIDELLRLRVAGVGRCNEDGAWTIVPPDAG